MKTRYFLRLALSNLRRNTRLFLPGILTSAGLTAVLYIVLAITADPWLKQVSAGSYLSLTMTLGLAVHYLLTAVMVLYIAAFVTGRRGKEFGLYHVLGMEKRHICRMLGWECLISSLITVLGGIALGMVLYRLCALALCRLVGAGVGGFRPISGRGALLTVLFFGALEVLAYLRQCRAVRRMNTAQLLHSAEMGEKEPKIRWAVLVVGVVCLCGGYAISLNVKNPLAAIALFFLAAALVAAGTYCLFLSGTTAVLKLLKSRRRYYYRKNHMPAVSGLLFRMRRNAVSLASVCLLATMVLVMVSTTVSLYVNAEEAIALRFPRQMYLSANVVEDGLSRPVPEEVMNAAVDAALDGLTLAGEDREHYLDFSALRRGNELLMDQSQGLLTGSLTEIFLITEEEYARLTGRELSLLVGEAAVWEAEGNSAPLGGSVTIGGMDLKLRSIPEFPVNTQTYASTDRLGMVVSAKAYEKLYAAQKEAYAGYASGLTGKLWLDFASPMDVAAAEEFSSRVRATLKEWAGGRGLSFEEDDLWRGRENLYGLYGSFLFLGGLLSVVFLFATALMIYFKQISEGYEDRERFRIMQKVGMTREEVRHAIRSQILLVFFLPPAAAAIHLAFAFPILLRVLNALAMNSSRIFLLCCVGAIGLFMAVYILIYRLTARTYEKIVK